MSASIPVPPEFSIAMRHTICGKIAFFHKPGDYRISADARFPNGRSPEFGSIVFCGTCGLPCDSDSLIEEPRVEDKPKSDLQDPC